MKNLKVTQTDLIALLVMIVGQVAAFVPSFAADKAIVISAGTAAITAAFLVAKAIHAVASSNVTAEEVKQGAANLVRSEIGKVDFNKLVEDAVDAKGLPSAATLEALVKSEVNGLLQKLSSLGTQEPSPAPAQPAA